MTEQRRRVLVTGATKGIGRAIVDRLVKEYEVVGVARSRPEDFPSEVRLIQADLTDLDAVRDLAAQLGAEEPYHGIVNNFGLSPAASFMDTTLDILQVAYHSNVVVPLLLTQSVLPGMRAAGMGRIVNISSRAALGRRDRAAYAASKSAVVGMSRCLALEVAADNITVNAVAPGPVETEGFLRLNPAGEPQTLAFVSAIPVQRVGLPSELAQVVALLLSPELGYMTGQTLHVDGGLTVAAVK